MKFLTELYRAQPVGARRYNWVIRLYKSNLFPVLDEDQALSIIKFLSGRRRSFWICFDDEKTLSWEKYGKAYFDLHKIERFVEWNGRLRALMPAGFLLCDSNTSIFFDQESMRMLLPGVPVGIMLAKNIFRAERREES